MDPRLVKHSKFLSRVLRHKPETIGIELDAQGWVEVDVLLAAAGRAGKKFTRDELIATVEQNDKQRFTIRDGRIRANQGHSVDVDLGLASVEPPGLLYHGTADRFLSSIRSEGLSPRGRRHVHLSVDRQTATAVGTRHGRVVVLTVQAGAMHRDGHAFYLSENGVWLSAHVPPRYLANEESQP